MSQFYLKADGRITHWILNQLLCSNLRLQNILKALVDALSPSAAVYSCTHQIWKLVRDHVLPRPAWNVICTCFISGLFDFIVLCIAAEHHLVKMLPYSMSPPMWLGPGTALKLSFLFPRNGNNQREIACVFQTWESLFYTKIQHDWLQNKQMFNYAVIRINYRVMHKYTYFRLFFLATEYRVPWIKIL